MSYNNDYMYAVDRSDEFLAHYGVKGMKWGVRKALESGNSRALARQYRKASRKLAKLQKQANNGKKYARRAAALGAGAAALGGAAAVGTQGIARAANTVMAKGGSAMRKAGTAIGAATPGAAATLSRLGFKKTAQAVNTVGSKAGAGLRKAGLATGVAAPRTGQAISNWGRATGLSVDTAATRALRNTQKSVNATANKQISDIMNYGIKNNNIAGATALANNARANLANTNASFANRIAGSQKKISNNTLARIGAGAAAAGLAGAAGYNAYRAATTKKAAARAAEFQREMNKAFKGTQYANGGQGQSSGNRKRRRRK